MNEDVYFVPNGDSRKETAILLVGTAEEFGLPQSDIRAVRGGFHITKALADKITEEDADAGDDAATDADDTATEEKPSSRRTKKKPSGNRAAKTNADSGKE